MSKLGKKLLTAGLCLGLALGTVTGCGANPNAGKAVATLDGEKIDYALVNFMTRFNQAQMQTMYGNMLGENMWDSYGESVKGDILNNIQQMMTMEKHMEEYGVSVTEEDKTKITEAASKFMEDNDKDVLAAMTASQETVERMLTLSMINNRMYNAIIKDVDTNVTDEEAQQTTVKYVMFSTADTTDEDGKSVAMTDEEKAAQSEKAQQVLDAVKEGTDMDEAAKAVDENLSASTTSFGKDNGTIDEKVKAAAADLKDGETAESVIQGENGYYVVQMQAVFDAEATENQKNSIVSQRKSDKFSEVYDAWKEASELTKDEKLLADITFKNTFEIKAKETEAAETESAAETENAAETESASETETAAE